MIQMTNSMEDYKRIVKELKKTGEATHNGLTFELNDTCKICEVYDSAGEYLFALEHVSEIKEYC